MELSELEKLVKDYADTKKTLTERVIDMTDEVELVKRKYVPGIKRIASTVAEKLSVLREAILDNTHLFIKPRTFILHGIKVGLQKGKGELSWDDDEQVVKLIKKHFPEKTDVLIQTKEVPVKSALAALTVKELERIGITVENTGDEPVVKSTDNDIDKFVKSLLKEDDKNKAA